MYVATYNTYIHIIIYIDLTSVTHVAVSGWQGGSVTEENALVYGIINEVNVEYVDTYIYHLQRIIQGANAC